jgi:hypothetical protein
LPSRPIESAFLSQAPLALRRPGLYTLVLRGAANRDRHWGGGLRVQIPARLDAYAYFPTRRAEERRLTLALPAGATTVTLSAAFVDGEFGGQLRLARRATRGAAGGRGGARGGGSARFPDRGADGGGGEGAGRKVTSTAEARRTQRDTEDRGKLAKVAGD